MMWQITRARSSSDVLVSRSPSSEVPGLPKDLTWSGGREATASRAGDSSPVRCDNGRMYFEVDALLNYALDRQQDYQHASPFPHLVIDNFFPESVLTEVVRDFPTESTGTWKRFNDPRHVKLLSKGDSYLAPSIRHLLAQLRTAEFLSFLEVLSGIDGVVADPHNGGCHQTNADGFLDVHVDASWNDRLALYTGINLIIYLNRDWKEDYGGHLELLGRRRRTVRQPNPSSVQSNGDLQFR